MVTRGVDKDYIDQAVVRLINAGNNVLIVDKRNLCDRGEQLLLSLDQLCVYFVAGHYSIVDLVEATPQQVIDRISDSLKRQPAILGLKGLGRIKPSLSSSDINQIGKLAGKAHVRLVTVVGGDYLPGLSDPSEQALNQLFMVRLNVTSKIARPNLVDLAEHTLDGLRRHWRNYWSLLVGILLIAVTIFITIVQSEAFGAWQSILLLLVSFFVVIAVFLSVMVYVRPQYGLTRRVRSQRYALVYAIGELCAVIVGLIVLVLVGDVGLWSGLTCVAVAAFWFVLGNRGTDA